ncbi:MAG TPA: tRNA lysidine(34) synthetase TilS [Alphaproteobacteria bacterium]|nr:tRNA lysidine(34) synthetase TilS [Alphaproteobacteria bacterium]
MTRLGPFERAPHLAVAVSGGADSMALTLLAAHWARSQDGGVTAISIDHGLRPESAAEAHKVGAWCGDLGTAHVTLTWTGHKPGSGIQSAARAARYALLGDWCRQNGVLHLLTAHHLEDQAETVLLRLGRGSGPDGLAAMPAIAEAPHYRLLRPLLDISKSALVATLQAARQDWLEDPSNHDPAHTRTRLRQFSHRLEQAGVPADGFATMAASHGQARAQSDDAVAALLAAAATLHPEGWCALDPIRLAEAKPEHMRRALTRVIVTVAGRAYPPRGARLERVCEDLRRGDLGAARTIGGCRIVPTRGSLLVCREPAAARQRLSAAGRGLVRWDNRFTLTLSGTPELAGDHLRVARLGRAGWAALAADRPELRKTAVPAPVRPSLPALWDGEALIAVPNLGYWRSGRAETGLRLGSATFSPSLPLVGARFGVAK